MKLNSLLLIAIYGVFSVFAASFFKEEAAVSSSQAVKLVNDDDDEFILVEADVVGANSPVESPLYPKLETPDAIKMELARIKGQFVNGKMTETATIDLLVLVYQAFNTQMGTLEMDQIILNEVFQLIIEIPERSYFSVGNKLINYADVLVRKDIMLERAKLKTDSSNEPIETFENVNLFELLEQLIINAANVEVGIYESVKNRYRRNVNLYFHQNGFEIKNINGVKGIFEEVATLSNDSPYQFLRSVPSNLNLRNYLRFFMCVYAMSLQCKYISIKGKFPKNYLNMVFYNAATVFLRAFPKESEYSELATNLLAVFNYSREMIVKEIANGELPVKKALLETIQLGLNETAALILSLEASSLIPSEEMILVLCNSANSSQFQVFKTIYEAWSKKLDVRTKIDNVLSKAVAKLGFSVFIKEHLVEAFSISDWGKLINCAASYYNLSAVMALIRVSGLKNSIFPHLKPRTTIYNIVNSHFSDSRKYITKSHAKEVIKMIPLDCLVFPVGGNDSKNLEKLIADGQYVALKAKLEELIMDAKNQKYELVQSNFKLLIDKIDPYHFRKLMRRLDPDVCPVLVESILANDGFYFDHIEEAAYGAMESLNMSLLALLVNKYSFKISETFDKRWTIKREFNLNEAKSGSEKASDQECLKKQSC